MKDPRPCLFFDRDGVVNTPTHGYITHWKDFAFQEGIVDILRLATERGYLKILITNQQGVAKGLMNEADLEEIHRRMQDELAKDDATFDAIYTAIGLAGSDGDRKPSPAMICRAAAEHAVDLSRSWMIGDNDTDILAGNAAGVGTIRLTGHKPITEPATHTVDSMDALRRLLAKLCVSSR